MLHIQHIRLYELKEKASIMQILERQQLSNSWHGDPPKPNGITTRNCLLNSRLKFCRTWASPISQANAGHLFAIPPSLILQHGLSSFFTPLPEGGVLSVPPRLEQLQNSRHHTARADYSFWVL